LKNGLRAIPMLPILEFQMKLVIHVFVASFAVLQLAAHAFAVSSSLVDVKASSTAADFKVGPGAFIVNDTADDFSLFGGHVTATASAPNTRGESSAKAIAEANAQVGHLGVSVLGSVGGAPKNRPPFLVGGKATSSAVALAEWMDTVTLKSRSRIALRAVFNVFLDGDVGAFGSPASFASASVSIANPANSNLIFPFNNSPILQAGAASHSPLSGDDKEDVIGAFQVELFPPEGPFPIGLRLIAQGTADSNLSLNEANWDGDVAAYSGELSRSLTWGGLEGVYDFFTGEKLDDWSITSESGFDYSQPFSVPEPSSSVLLATLLCAAAARRRRAH
jgi:hypothetical protein